MNAATTALSKLIDTTMARFNELGRSGLLDPEAPRTGFKNPRFQEACLTLALSLDDPELAPDKETVSLVETASIRALGQWTEMQERNGAVRSSPDGVHDPLATAYGVYAVARTLEVLSDRVSASVRSQTYKALKRGVRFLLRAPVPSGPEPRSIRAAAISAVGHTLHDDRLAQTARNIRADTVRRLRQRFDERAAPHLLDAGALTLALGYITLCRTEPDEQELELWRMISRYVLNTTTPSGIVGGGAEASVACLPLTTGFALASTKVGEAATLTRLLDKGWKTGWYDPLLDPDVPWLTPMGYLMLEDRARRPDNRKLGRLTVDPPEETFDEKGGRLTLGDWTMRLGPGGTLGWLHHNPTGSSRLFGSPAGMALREGPWMIEGNRIRQPSLAGAFTVEKGTPIVFEGSLHSLPIPGTVRSPRRVGHPNWHDREARVGTRLTPPFRPGNARSYGAPSYLREIEIKDGALTIETHLEGRIMCRLPMIWAGGMFGEVQIDKTPVQLGKPVQERRVREIIFSGGSWPAWILRFDRPVDMIYEPIHVSVTSSPMRYLTAATGTLDLMANDRLHMAWRVAE